MSPAQGRIDSRPLPTGESLRLKPIVLCQRPPKVERPAPHAVTTVLEEMGLNVRTYPDGPIPLEPDGIVWLQGNANWFPRVRGQIEACPPPARPLIVHWFSEPLPPPRAAGLPRPRLALREIVKILLRDRRVTDVYSNAARLKALARDGIVDLLVASTPARQQYLAEQGIQAEFVPLGYRRDKHGHNLGLERTRDVLFLGALTPRRRRLLGRLRQSGIEIEQLGSWTDPACWGANRTRLLNQTRIYLNLARYAGELPGLRLILGMANKCLVVSEPIYEAGPYVPGEHFVECTIEDMPKAIRYYLDHPEERQRIVDAGHRLVTETVTVERSVERILGLIEAEIRLRHC